MREGVQNSSSRPGAVCPTGGEAGTCRSGGGRVRKDEAHTRAGRSMSHTLLLCTLLCVTYLRHLSTDAKILRPAEPEYQNFTTQLPVFVEAFS